MARSRERRYTYATTLTWGGDEPTAELEVVVSFTVAWGAEPSGMFGPPENYDPGSADEIEDIRVVSVDGKPWPVDLSFGFQSPEQDHEMIVDRLDDHYEEMIRSAIEECEADRDDAADHRRRSARESWL